MDFTGLENELLQDTTEALPSEEEAVEERLYTVGWGEKVGGDGPGEMHGAEMTAAELEEHFNNDHKGSVQLRETFGTFENYLSYMDKREDIKESIGVNTWQEDRAAEREQIEARYFELINKKMSNPSEFTAEEEAEMQQYAANNQDLITGAYKEWADDPAFAELNEEYGISDQYTDEKGRNYTWNGMGWIKTNEPDSFNLIETFLKTTAGVTFGMAAGGFAAGLLPYGTPAAVSSALSSAVGTLTSQIVQTGEVSVEDILKAAAQGGASTAVLGQLQDIILSGNNAIVNEIVDWAATGINKVKDTIGSVTSSGDFPDWVWDGAGVVVDIIEGIQDPLGGDGSGLPNMGEGGATTLPDLTPDEEPVEEEIEEEVEEEEEVVVEDELEEEDEETVIVQPEEEVEEELEEEEEEIVDIVGEDPEKDGGVIGGILDSIFGSVPDPVEEEEETVILPPEVVEEEEDKTVIVNPPEDFTPPPVKDDDFNDPEDDEQTIIIPPEIEPPVSEPPPGVEPPPGGGGSPEGGPGDGTDWSELFRYTNIKNPELSKYAPTIASVRSMFNELS